MPQRHYGSRSVTSCEILLYVLTMKEIGRRIYNVIRSILVTAILAVTTVYIVLYLFMSIPSVQSHVRQVGSRELGHLLGTAVSIGDISITPFNQLVLHDVLLPDERGDTVLYADKVGVGFSVFNFIAHHRLVFTYAELIGVDVRLGRQSAREPLNIQFIIDAFSPKQKNNPPKQYDLNIQNIVIRRSRFSYDVKSADTLPQGRFDANHVGIEDFRADISLPRISNDSYEVKLKRLSFYERNGFTMKNMSLEAIVNDSCIALSDMKIELPGTLVAPEDITLHIAGIKQFGQWYDEVPIDIAFTDNYVSPSDFKTFLPQLEAFSNPIRFTVAVSGTVKDFDVSQFDLSSVGGRLRLAVAGRFKNVSNPDSMQGEVRRLQLSADAGVVATILSGTTGVSRNARKIISNCGNIKVNGTLHGGMEFANFAGTITTSVGEVALNGLFANKGKSYKGHVETTQFDVGRLLSKEDLIGTLACNIDIDADRHRSFVIGKFGHIDVKGYRYNDITANVELARNRVNGRVDINDENGSLVVEGNGILDGENTVVDVMASVSKADLAKLNLTDRFPGKELSFDLDVAFEGYDLNGITGIVRCENLEYCDSAGTGLHLSKFLVEADNKSMPKVIKVTSDVVNGTVSGQYDVHSLAQSVKTMLSRPLPALFSDSISTTKHETKVRKAKRDEERARVPNNVYFNFNIDNLEEVAEMFKLPVKPLSPVTIDGFITDSNHSMYLLVDAPYLQQKNKLIEGTRLQASLDNMDGNLQVDAYSIIPLKKGKLALTVAANGVNDRIDSNVSWTVDGKRSYSGEVSLSSLFTRDTLATMPPAIHIDVNPTELLFNDTVWQVHRAQVDVLSKRIAVKDFYVTCENQFLKINGMASGNPDDEMVVELSDINLDYVFETLAINNVTFGGRATGVFYASDLFSGVPRMYTEGLFVKSLSYNQAVFGDAKILSSWINDDKCVTIQADVAQKNGKRTKIDGQIFIARDSLYFDFKPERVNVAFLKPFMSAFSSDVQGEASGHVELYGTFKNINLRGDVFADSLRMKLDYTNVYYTAVRDSVKMRPGLILIDDIELKDPMGHTAHLSGKVTHNYFHDATFDFSLTNADNLLSFDVTQKMNPEWYGRIFCNGSAFIEGRPGFVNIDVNMATADNSSFTFVLSDTKVATEYDFITFVDRNKGRGDDALSSDTRPEKVREFLEQQKTESSGSSSQFNINLMIEATPQAQMNLVMDPSGGDKIKAVGNGNLRIGYNSADEEMTMFGTYTLVQGNYNFTLQDIIIKDFSIREGSSLTFNGNPLSAVMDIEAMYSLHANIADLDESFATDGELNRTNVPVNALLRLQGDISAPEISFDLEFPTLTSDVYRKVMSIISTEDMMNRQIIYLLALNSFYTPDYMTDNSRSNELASVASSTISSQLSNLLGQMSENWSISPNLRSENGDFSDIEVELALSSQLLNNRLLFNGNFGYRDNALNARNSNFIGDFDIEYLLTKNGNIRLKAYNHYNDQNYYVRSALTTQGVGVVFKHDFDDIYDFLWRKKPQRKAGTEVSTDTATAAGGDAMKRERVETDD